MKNVKTFEDFVNENYLVNEARSPKMLKDNSFHDGFIYQNHNYTLGLLIDRKFFDKSNFFDKSRANRKGVDWEGMKDLLDANRETERRGNFAKALWDNDSYVIVGKYKQSDSYLHNLHSHLQKQYPNYKADIIKNFSFNSKAKPVLGDLW